MDESDKIWVQCLEDINKVWADATQKLVLCVFTARIFGIILGLLAGYLIWGIK